MDKRQHDAGSRYVRTLFHIGSVGGLTDGQLLERFTARGGEAAELAFETLLERHGPMVLGVCRSVLRDPHEAEDAVQATFLVLARRAGGLWVRDSLGPWLHQVAYRVAACARAAAARRRRHEQRAGALVLPQSSPGAPPEVRDDVSDVLHDEVNRLPQGCRAAVVLCYFEGLSPEQAARQLGCPVGTVQSRLARGRARLRSRLTRRGLAPALGVLGTVGAADAAAPPAPLPAALVEATIRATLPRAAGAAMASGAVTALTQGVLRSMFLVKLRIVAAALITIGVLAAGAQALRQEAPAPVPPPNLDQVRAELGAAAGGPGKPAPEANSPVPGDLTWTDIAPDERLSVMALLAAQAKGNYGKIKTWQGVYSYVLRQHLNEGFVAQLRAGIQPEGRRPAAPEKAEALLQEFDQVLTFAVDLGADALYRDIETNRMRFFKLGTSDEVQIPNVGADDHRSIVTPELYLVFRPKEQATSAFLPNLAEARNKRRVDRFPVAEGRNREGGSPDPRGFFKFDPGNSFWSGLDLYAEALRGESGAEAERIVKERLKLAKAEGPGGRWYREQMGFGNPGEPVFWVTTLWSPQAGYNPVSHVRALGQPDGKVQSRIEWQWKLMDGIYVPEAFHETIYREAGGGISLERDAKMKESAVNRPLGPHQFDERGLGLSDGDLILNHLERVAYIMKGGEPVKLAEFGAGSVLRPIAAKPAPAPAAAAAARPRNGPAGRIYTTASLGTSSAGMPIFSVVAVV
jgi:RNA polymerase sigma factor (sigma-70 family)